MPLSAIQDRLRLLECQATLQAVHGTEVLTPREAELVIAELRTAGDPPLLTEGLPTIMRVVAWLCHEGVNKNDLAFLASELPAAAAKIAAPNLLPMDFNHSAVVGSPLDQKAIGVWYRAEYAWNPAALDGKGAHGILAHGMMWSWLNPDISTTLLAEQARLGHIRFSMACVASRSEYVPGPPAYEIAHDPIFFTLSALDVANADPDANGFGFESETSPDLEARMRTTLVTKHLDEAGNVIDPTYYKVGADNVTVWYDPELVPAGAGESSEIDALLARLRAWKSAGLRAASLPPVEDVPMDELLAVVKEHVAKLADKESVAAITAALTELSTTLGKRDELMARVAALESAANDAGIAHAAALDAGLGKIAELETALAAAKTELEKAQTAMTALEATHADAVAKLEAIAAKEAEVAAAALFAARLTSLPANYKAEHDKRADRAEVEARWALKSDDDWKTFVADISITPVRIEKSYLLRSEEEGRLLAGNADKASDSIQSRIHKYVD